ncbi:hypothetical protein ABN028_18600 [Actinopolymorpha sp. B17G11]|uniref:hypothetical protein n=1 Tax=Actinopolymorpha sp. B17G11 TaxID=3160861 RepID=UPI0032E52060
MAAQHQPSPEVLRALVEESTRKSSVIWLRYGDEVRARPAWHVWHDGAAYVVTAGPEADRQQGRLGEVEQHLPGLAEAETATVTCRAKDSRARLVTWRARVGHLTPRTPEWEGAAAALAGDRLNATDAAHLLERWSASDTILRLTPTGEVLEGPGRMPTDDTAVPPPDSPATTTGRLPWVVHKRARGRPRLS